jgi:hypothetical protein
MTWLKHLHLLRIDKKSELYMDLYIMNWNNTFKFIELYYLLVRMESDILKVRKVLILIMCILSFACGMLMAGADSSESKWIKLSSPYIVKENEGDIDYLYVVGGYHSIDSGTEIWGTANYSDIRLIGDKMGEIVITYENGTVDRVPLVFGYTLWYYNNWKTFKAPFDGPEKDEKMANLLKEALHLYGAVEGNEKCVLKIKLRDEKVARIEIEDNKEKNGKPEIAGAYIVSGDVGQLTGGSVNVDTKVDFFEKYVIDSQNPYPDNVKNAIEEIRKGLYTFDEDYAKEPIPYEYEKNHSGIKVRFYGNNLARIASGVFYHNLKDLSERVDENGLLHESYKDSPLYHDSFGTWQPGVAPYYNMFFTRNRSFTVLTAFGYKDLADRAVGYANKKMMFFRENKLTIGGVQIPGHFTVTINDPMYYSETLVPIGWPTVYTKKAFGDEYKNLGNQETDGHGLMMIGNYNVWKSLGKPREWVENNWVYINEACEWILWCFDNPKLSFARKGLLFAESEGGMQEYTLYCNVPCYLGLLCYAEMADAIGKQDAAALWRKTAETMKEGIESYILNTKYNKWSLHSGRIGFMHDPVLSMLADVYGFDKADIPQQDWLEYSLNTYPDDIKSVSIYNYHGGVGGLGYNHCIMTQNALLTDHMADATKLVENLTKICYAPGKDKPYLAPEKFTYDSQNGLYLKNGDLGNLYQLVEALRCYHTVMGVSVNNDGVLKIFPRLPYEWGVEIAQMPIERTNAHLALNMTYPKDGVQLAVLQFSEENVVEKAKARFGPFPADTTVCKVQINGQEVDCELFESGDSKWAIVEFSPSKRTDIAALYSTDSNLPQGPFNWPEFELVDGYKAKTDEKSGVSLNTYLAIAVLALSVVFLGVVVYKKKNGLI